MKRIMTVAMIFIVMFVVGCGSEKSKKEITHVKPPIIKITRAEAQTKLAELSIGLEGRQMDEREQTQEELNDFEKSFLCMNILIASRLNNIKSPPAGG